MLTHKKSLGLLRKRKTPCEEELCIFCRSKKMGRWLYVGDKQASSFLVTATLVCVQCGYFFNMALKVFRKGVL